MNGMVNTSELNSVMCEAQRLSLKMELYKDYQICLLYGLLASKDNIIDFILRCKYNLTENDVLEYINSLDTIYDDDYDSTYFVDKVNKFVDRCHVILPKQANQLAYTTRFIACGFFIPAIEQESLKEFFKQKDIKEEYIVEDINETFQFMYVESDMFEYCEKFSEDMVIDYLEGSRMPDGKNLNIKRQVTNLVAKDERLKENEAWLTDMNYLASIGESDPVIGRDEEIYNIISILGKRGKSNPILLGEAGVGKTAVVEGLVKRIIEGNVPDSLKKKVVLDLNVNALIAGCKYRGDLEERVTQILNACSNRDDIIFFIDEIHTIVNGSNSKDEAASVSIANALKPALSRGKIKIIGATTLKEYKSTIEKDAALDRRFQQVVLTQPNQELTFKILNGLKERYEKYHDIKISEEVIKYIISLADKYIKERNFPDKAIDIMDEACVLAKMGNEKLQSLDETSIKMVISRWKNVKISEISDNNLNQIGQLKEKIKEVIIGQDEAIEKVDKILNLSSLGFINENKPLASFFIVGNTGVGKTFFAKTLAKALYEDKELIQIDMSEYMESNSVSKLIGSPPGYVGFDTADVFSEKVRRNMQSVVLVDEIDKAHPDIINIFLQVLEDGRLTDSFGRKVDFTQTIIIFTANTASYMKGKNANYFTQKNVNNTDSEIIQEVRNKIGPEIMDRVNEVLVFNNLTEDDLRKIINIEAKKVIDKLSSKGYNIEVNESVYTHLYDMCNNMQSARNIKSLVNNEFSRFIMDSIIDGNIKKDGYYILTYSSMYSYKFDVKILKTRKIVAKVSTK